jgi:hypothetical protein
MNTRLTAGTSLGKLVNGLRRAGWGDLAGADTRGVRATLQALADLLPPNMASGRVTAPQLAEVAGYSERWTRSRLVLLEDAGVITWTRGGVVAGKPVPSLIRVHKTVLLELIKNARRLRDAMLARYRAAQRRRLEGVMNTFRRNKIPGKRAGQPHAEVATGLPPYGEVSRRPPAPTGRDRYDIPICRHGGDGTRFDDGVPRCPSCRRLEGS